MSDILKLVGARIRTLRKAKNLTQENLAEKAGLHYSYIGGVERGDRNISLSTLEKIITALEVSPVQLFQHQDIDIDDIDDELSDKRTILEAHRAQMINRSLQEIKLIYRITKDILSTFDSCKGQS